MNSKLHWEKSLAYLFPDIATECHPTRNASELSPNDVTRGSERKVWWSCPKGYEYETTIACSVAGRNCPYYCSIAINEQTKEWT